MGRPSRYPSALRSKAADRRHRQTPGSLENLGDEGILAAGSPTQGDDMRGLTFHGNQDVRVEEIPEPTLEAPTDAIVRVTMAGICGSDLHILNAGEAFGFPPAHPALLKRPEPAINVKMF